MMRYILLLSGFVWALVSCVLTDAPVPDGPLFAVPKGFPQPRYALDKNPLTPAGVALGRTLFYDAKLSRDNSIACAECHSQPYAFTHHGHDLSHGIDNRLGTRNALPLQNLAWTPAFGWDGGVFDLDLFPVVPIQEHVEMDETISNVLAKLRADKTYPARFKAAFGTEAITTARFLQALSQFMLTLVTANSRYDRYRRGEAGATLRADELAGKALFVTKGCANCHSGELFTDYSYRNNGLNLAYNQDEGRARITERPEDRYTFRVPSLRNVEHSFPYMHDGRFRTLEAVLDHYATGVENTPNLDPLLKQNGGQGSGAAALGIPMTDDEQANIIAFLKTLSDDPFLRNPNFAAP